MEPHKDSILGHMNHDHQPSVRRYLEHYHGLSSFAARNAGLVDISTTSLRITTAPHADSSKPGSGPDAATTYTIPFEPPLKSLGEARERLVAMDKTARAALGRDDVSLTKWIAPEGPQLLMTLLLFSTYVTLYNRQVLAPETAPELLKPVIAQFPTLFQRLHEAAPKLLYGTLGVHVFEAIAIHFSKLKKHSVATGSALWWAWILSTVHDGFTNFTRINAYVAAEKKRLATKKH